MAQETNDPANVSPINEPSGEPDLYTEKVFVTTSTKPVAATSEREVSEKDELEEGFFPWISRPGERATFKKASFPWQGLIGLIGAALTVVASWGLLFGCNDTQQWQQSRPQVAKVLTPAAILSAIISANGILLHMAFSSGMSIAWWLRASKSKATVGELHETWVYSSGILGAVQAGRRFNYVALATIVVAMIPINGVLLQGALGVRNVLVDVPIAGITLPFSGDFPAGASGYLSKNGTPEGIDSEFSIATYNFFTTPNHGSFLLFYSNESDAAFNAQNQNYLYTQIDYPSGCQGTCSFDAPGVGFWIDCSDTYLVDYDFQVDETQPDWQELPVVKDGLPVYSVKFDWDVSNPNTIHFDMLGKDSYKCTGKYEQVTCNLTAVSLKFPTLLQMNVSIAQDEYGTMLSVPPASDYGSDKFVDFIKPDDELQTGGTKFGFLAEVFNNYFGSEIKLQYQSNSGQPEYFLTQTGIFANGPGLLYGPNGEENQGDKIDMDSYGKKGCEVFLDTDDYPLSLEKTEILNSIRQFMFYLSLYYGYDQTFGVPPLIRDTTNMVAQNRYHVVWWHWAASLGVTLLVVLCVTPTFWGFWNLARPPTMSPLETARAFNAPVLADQNPTLATPEILREVHGRNLHGPHDSTT